MKLAAFAASMALAFAPLSALADDKQAYPLPGGVATSSIDLEDDDVLAAIVLAGGVLVLGAVVILVAQDDDGSFVVSTSTTSTGP